MESKLDHYPEYGRPIVYFATWTAANGGGGSCVFSTREEAIRYVKFTARLMWSSDWSTWTAPQGQYPDESARDDVRLDPTFRAKFDRGVVEVRKTEVCGLFDWGAQ